ncbi:unnamed protein product [Symbiodinium sp. CCMP2592]|nr:unnamed protein product [Symbiodinium sp. CCMP2592]
MPLTPEAVAEISRLVEESSRKGDFLVRNVQQIFAVLKRHSLLQRMRIPPKAVGVHPANRDGSCLVVQDVHELLDNISAVGFEPTRTNPIAIEASSEAEQVFNKQLVESAGGQLGRLELGELKVLSLSSSHTNFALRLVADGAPHKSEVISVQGSLSLELVQKRDPVLAEYVLQGLEWTVIAAEVGQKWPDLLQLVQSSCNATLQKTESELQLLRRICTIVGRQTGVPDYQTVKRQALHSKPPCAECLPGLYQFALRHCGGADAFFLAETEMFLRSHGQSKGMGPSFWENVSADLKKGDQVTFFRHALVKLALSTNLVTATSVKKALAKDALPKAIKADEAMSKIRSMLTGAGVQLMSDTRLVNLLGVTDCTMAKLVLGLSPEDDKKYKAVEAVAHDCITVANGLLGTALVSPWAGDAEVMDAGLQQESSGSQGVQERLRELNPDGSLKNPIELLSAEGFIVGACIKKKGEKFEGQIGAMDDSNVTVKDLKSGGVLKVPARDLLNSGWMVFKPKAEPESIAALQSMGPKKNNDFLAGLVIAEIHQAMHELVKTHDSQKILEGLSLQLKPCRALVSQQVFGKGKLILVPYSWKVCTRSPKPEPMANAVQVQTKWKLDDREFWLQSCNSLPKDSNPEVGKHFISPYFLVGSCEDEDSANMVQVMSGTVQSSVRIPMLKNSKEIGTGTALHILKVKQADEEEHAPKAKKAKTTKK